jgi:hypothetical protein
MLRQQVTKNSLKRSVVTISTLVIGLITVAFSGSSVLAATGGQPNGFSISPVLSEETVNKGQTSTFTIYVQNPTNIPVQAEAVVNDFRASSDESGTPSIILNNNATLPANNFRSLVDPISNISIGPNQQAAVNISLTVPADANPGGYYGAIRFVPLSSNKKSTVGLTASVGSLVLVTVPGNLVENLNLVQLSAAANGNTSDFFTTGNPLSIVTRLKNTGNIYFAPFGKIQIVNMFNKVVMRYEFNSEDGNILPNSIRRYSHILPEYHWFGRYKIEANLGYGSNGALLSDTATFWYIPTWFMVLAIIVIIALVALIYWARLKIKSKRRNKSRR